VLSLLTLLINSDLIIPVSLDRLEVY